MICRDRLAEPFLERAASFLHGITFGGHPVSCAVGARQPRRRSSARTCSSTCGRTRPSSASASRACATCRSSATCAARATSTRSSSSRPGHRRRRSPTRSREWLLRGFLSPRLFEPGSSAAPTTAATRSSSCRRRWSPAPTSSTTIERSLRTVLDEAWKEFGRVTLPLVVGVPREVKDGEHRVAITPDGVRELAAHGVDVLVEAGAGRRLGDHRRRLRRGRRRDRRRRRRRVGTRRAGAEGQGAAGRRSSAPAARPRAVHLPPPRRLPRRSPTRCSSTKATGIAYETVQLADGALPLLAPMSEVAGRHGDPGRRALPRARARAGAACCSAARPGVRPARVVVIGAGNVGWNSAWIAQGMEAEVILLDKNLDRLRFVDQIHKGRIMTLASNRGTVERARRRRRPRRSARCSCRAGARRWWSPRTWCGR